LRDGKIIDFQTRVLFFRLAFFQFRKIRDMFSLKQPDQSGWKNFEPAASIAALPFAASLFEFQPSTNHAGAAPDISRQTKGVFTCVRFKSQNHCSYY
jgi:hypothetical protein